MTLYSRANQRAEILQLLIAARGDWVSLLEIRNRACQYNARILELRRLGLRIENKMREIGGKRLSWFRILSAPAVGSEARPKERTKDGGSGAALEEPSLFGSLAPQRRYPD